MVMNEREVRKECVKLAELSSKLLRQYNDLEKVVAGAKKREELLLDYIDNICSIIEAEMPLKEQDLWLEDCVKMGFYKREQEQ
jgi:uncharacterized protein YeeX (DUF496 family)